MENEELTLVNKLWHDDVRRPPDLSWIWARTNEQAQMILQSGKITEASLDHDMGLHEHDPDEEGADIRVGTSEDDGTELVKWMIERDLVPERVTIHSWNPDGARRMAMLLQDHCDSVFVRPYEAA